MLSAILTATMLSQSPKAHHHFTNPYPNQFTINKYSLTASPHQRALTTTPNPNPPSHGHQSTVAIHHQLTRALIPKPNPTLPFPTTAPLPPIHPASIDQINHKSNLQFTKNFNHPIQHHQPVPALSCCKEKKLMRKGSTRTEIHHGLEEEMRERRMNKKKKKMGKRSTGKEVRNGRKLER